MISLAVTLRTSTVPDDAWLIARMKCAAFVSSRVIVPLAIVADPPRHWMTALLPLSVVPRQSH
jgi:hypothetical protein